MEWQTTKVANYCLFASHAKQPMHCWQATNAGQWSFEFAQAETTRFELREQGNPEPMASAIIELRWVYNRQRDRSFGWRVF